MEQRERAKRTDPERIEPERNVFGGTPPEKSSKPAATPQSMATAGVEAIGDAVSRAVDLGYQVIDEEIRIGQRAAQQINDRTYDVGAMAGDFREISERMLRYYTEIGALWINLINSFFGNVAAARPAVPDGAISIDLTASQAAQVCLHLEKREGPFTVYDLRAPNAACPPITGVTLAPGSDGQRLILRLTVPPGQPAGEYAGVVVDATGKPQGTLSVRVEAAKAP